MNQDVPIDFRSRHDSISERMKAYAIAKAGKLVRFHDRISSIQIVVGQAAHDVPEVEILVHVEHGGPFVAKEMRDHFNEAVDVVIDKIERQLTRDKERLKSHRAEGPRAARPKPKGPKAGGDAGGPQSP